MAQDSYGHRGGYIPTPALTYIGLIAFGVLAMIFWYSRSFSLEKYAYKE
jgi:uncharacterized membrane protein